MENPKNITLIILVLCVNLLFGKISQSSESQNNTLSNNPDVNSIGAIGLDMTTNDDFYCTLSFSKKNYIKGEHVIANVRLTNRMDKDVSIRDCEQHFPFYQFEINDPAWRKMKLKKELETSFTKLNPDFKTIKPNESYEVEINLSDWYDFSQIGRYSIKAKWCCFMKRAPYERNSVSFPIIIAPKEQNDWFDPNGILFGPSWTNIPENWTEKILREKLATYLKTNMERDFNDITTSTKDDGIHLAYHTREYYIEGPSDKHLNADNKPYKAEAVPRTEIGPQPDGLILDIWLDKQNGQLIRPQLLDRTYWKLYATELYLPEMKLYLEANINYGADFNKNVLAKYMDLAGWMDDITKVKASFDPDSKNQ